MATATVMLETLRELSLSESEIDMIIEEAERILTETLAAHEFFIANDRQLPQDSWKRMKSKEHVRVYRSRRSRKGTTTTSSKKSILDSIIASNISDDDNECRSASISINDTLLNAYDFTLSNTSSVTSESSATGRADGVPILSASTSSSNSSSTTSWSVHDRQRSAHEEISVEINRVRPADRPLLIATGVLPGTVDDVAFGMLAHTDRLWRHRDAHLDEQFAAEKILATITRPTPESPFNSLTVKWCAKNVLMMARMRDCVFIEANGVATSASGERVAYTLLHSIDSLPRLPSFKHLDVVRVNMSRCYLSRQLDQSSVEVFFRGFADQGGRSSEGWLDNQYAGMVLSIVHAVDCAYVKKLVWLAHQKQAATTARITPPSRCEQCASSFSSVSSLFSSSVSCQACKREICGKCNVTKKVAMDTKDGAVKMKSTIFCLKCVVEATRALPQEVAVTMLGLN